ncbi:MAG: hypothetical protein PHZ02_16985, partial [Desulfocapsaceae bacterium]|nr:hypothetical protein [Desulfocapsaceae bacterium]
RRKERKQCNEESLDCLRRLPDKQEGLQQYRGTSCPDEPRKPIESGPKAVNLLPLFSYALQIF